jgi:hypothetical protein
LFVGDAQCRTLRAITTERGPVPPRCCRLSPRPVRPGAVRVDADCFTGTSWFECCAAALPARPSPGPPPGSPTYQQGHKAGLTTSKPSTRTGSMAASPRDPRCAVTGPEHTGLQRERRSLRVAAALVSLTPIAESARCRLQLRLAVLQRRLSSTALVGAQAIAALIWGVDERRSLAQVRSTPTRLRGLRMARCRWGLRVATPSWPRLVRAWLQLR